MRGAAPHPVLRTDPLPMGEGFGAGPYGPSTAVEPTARQWHQLQDTEHLRTTRLRLDHESGALRKGSAADIRAEDHDRGRAVADQHAIRACGDGLTHQAAMLADHGLNLGSGEVVG